MTQLTSIENLRNSTAMQSRVTTVENFLKGINRDWKANWFFPIAIINVSNGQDDMEWVRSHTSTHHKGAGMLKLGAQTAPAAQVIESLKGLRLETRDELHAKINTALSAAFGNVGLAWDVGMQTAEDAAAQAPFVPGTESSTGSANTQPKVAAKKSAAKKSSTVKPIATKPSKPTKLDEAKRLFADLTPKQKVELVAFAEQKILASKPCLAEREKLNTAVAG